MDPEYLDKNYAGILIVWDRLFGSYADERFRPHYGLTKQVSTYNVWTLQTHEYLAIVRDVRHAYRLRDRLGYVFRPARLGAPPHTRRGRGNGAHRRRHADGHQLVAPSVVSAQWIPSSMPR
jgi:hypothetical protein